MSVTINLTEGNKVTIQRQDPISLTLEKKSASSVSITQQANVAISLQNKAPVFVSIIKPGFSGAVTLWGSIAGTITNQGDLVDYIAEQIAEIPTPPTPTLQSVTDEGNTTSNSIAIGRSSATFLLDVGDGTTNTFITKRNPNGDIYIGSSNNTRFGFSAGQVNLGFATGGEDNNVPLALGTFSNAQPLILGTDNLERVRIDGPTGNVGIGTTSPAYKLDVDGTFRAGSISSSNSVTIGTSGATTISTTSGNTGLTIQDGSNGILAIKGAAQTFRLLTLGSAQRFEIRDLTNSDATRLAITSSGNVGIGTTSPLQPLHIATNNNNTSLALRVSNDHAAGRAGISFNLPNITNEIYSVGVDNDRYFKISNGINLSTNTRMVISPVGNVGINTTAPQSKLAIGSQAGTIATIADLRGDNDSDFIQVARATDTARGVKIFASGRINASSTHTSEAAYLFNHTSSNATTTGDREFFQINGGWSPSSGTSTWAQTLLTPTINTTGTYAGTVRGIYYNPTVTSATGATHRAIETTAGDVIFNGGNVGIGTTSPSQKLHVEGTSLFVGQGTWPMRMENNVSSGHAEMGLWTVSDVYAATKNLSLVATPVNNQPVWYFQALGDGWQNITLQRYGGKVGIRTLEPSANLTVQGHGTTTGKTFLAQDSNASALFTILDNGNVGIGTTSPSSTLHVAGTIQQTVDAATNQYPIQLYNDHAGTDYYLLRQRVVDTGSKVRTGLGITGAPDAAFVLGPQTDQIIKFESTGSIVNVANISATGTMRLNASEIRAGDTSVSSAAHFNITSTNSSSKAALGLKQGASASNLMIDIRNSSGTPTMGITSEGGFYFKDSNVVGRYTFDHDYLPAAVDGLTTGFEFRTENASGVLTPFGYIDVTNDDRTLQQSSMRFSVGQSTPTEIMRLESSGNVGVNTTSPTSKMHINGTAMIQLRLEQQGGPASNTDTKGAVGDIAYDDLYFYIKTTNGWGRLLLDYAF